jgi:hypothetical protein
MPPPKTSYAKSGDVNVAYQVLGDGPIDLVYVWGGSRTWISSGWIRLSPAFSVGWRAFPG